MKASALIVLFAAVTAIGQADSLKSEIQKINRPITNAIKHKDVAAFKKVVKGGVTPDFKYVDDGHAMNFDQMIEGMKQGFAMYSTFTKVEAKIVSVSEKGSAGTAVEKHTMVGTMLDPKTKKNHVVAFEGTSDETFKKVNGKWLMASMAMKTDKMTMDGKPMPMQAMGGKG